MAALFVLPLTVFTNACNGVMGADTQRAPGSALTVTRGALETRVLLTGELQADESLELKTPSTDAWEVQLRWMAEDGSPVKEGDRIVEFDDTAMLDKIGELELAVINAGSELLNQQAATASETAEKRFAVVEQEIAVSKAKSDAGVPVGIVSRMQYSEYQLVLGRAEVARAAAALDKSTAISGGAIDEQIKRIAYDKAQRALEAAQAQIAALSITAPQDGVMVVGEHPWEGRKMQVGDTVFPGMAVAKLPDLSKMVVRAVLSDVDDGRVHPGMAVLCTLDAYPDRPIPGRVRSVSPVAREPEQSSGRRFFSVVIDLDQTDDDMMRPGLSAKVEVETASHAGVLLAPRNALDRSSTPARARLSGGDEVSVELGLCNAASCEVLSGLEEGAELEPIDISPGNDPQEAA